MADGAGNGCHPSGSPSRDWVGKVPGGRRMDGSSARVREGDIVRLLHTWQKQGELTLRDLKGCKLSGNFFNILFNLNKFVAFETRDPFLIRQVCMPPVSIVSTMTNDLVVVRRKPPNH